MNEGRRTQAVRAPGAGGFTPAASVAASNPCLNCGTNIQLTFCPECGQKEIDADPTLREFLEEAAAESLNWDSKLLSTLRLLFTRPGQLTMEYLDGRRIRYISPLKLYLWSSVGYFFLAALVPVHAPTAGAAALSAAARDSALASALPKILFVLMPLFAGLFAFFFRDSRRKYPQHLAFALHVHTVLFAGLALMLLARLTDAPTAKFLIRCVVGGMLGPYTVFAALRVYGGTHYRVAARLLGVAGGYLAAFLICVSGTLWLLRALG